MGSYRMDDVRIQRRVKKITISALHLPIALNLSQIVD